MNEKILDELASLVLEQKLDIEKYPKLKQAMEDYAYEEYEKTLNKYEVPSISTKEDLDTTIVDGYFQTHYFQSLGQEWRPLGYLPTKYQEDENQGLIDFLKPYSFVSDEEKEQFNETLKNQALYILAYEKEGTIEDIWQEAYLRTMLITGKDWITDCQDINQTYWKYDGMLVYHQEVYDMKINGSAEALTRNGLCTLQGDNGIKRTASLTYEGRKYVYQLTKNNK